MADMANAAMTAADTPSSLPEGEVVHVQALGVAIDVTGLSRGGRGVSDGLAAVALRSPHSAAAATVHRIRVLARPMSG